MIKLDPKAYKKDVGVRISVVRKAMGYNTRAQFTKLFPDWSEGRLANYESGNSLPSPIDVINISDKTSTNPSWIMFGIGSMRNVEQDINEVRHCNLVQLCNQLDSSQLTELRSKIKIKETEFNNLLKNPTAKIGKTLCNKIERALELEKGFMDESPFAHLMQNDNRSAQEEEMLSAFQRLSPKGKDILIKIAGDLSAV